jgi:hypothetical protein
MFLLLLQLLQTVDKSDSIHGHPLALLAEESKKFMKKDSTLFMPIFSQRHPHAAIFSASLVHKLYGNKLVSLYLLGLYKHMFSYFVLDEVLIIPLIFRNHFLTVLNI